MTRHRVLLAALPLSAVLLTTACGATGTIASDAPEPRSEAQARPGLRAGSVDDNAAFTAYLDYRKKFADGDQEVRDADVSGRRIVTVTDRRGRPLFGATVQAGDQRARTYADGRALIFGDGRITVSYGGATAAATGHAPKVKLPVTAPQGRARLQVLFLIDTTGSMGDEIGRLTASVDSVAARIAKLSAGPELELGMTLYRDKGDEYVTRTTDFTADVGTFREQLTAVRAEGGGDTPEDLNAALAEALAKPAWREDAVKLVFLIADAPPHLDYDGPDYLTEARRAAERGIKIEPIASSGLDDQGEYIYRQLAQLTMGRFTFLTYGADGVSPGDKTEHHVSEYAVLALDDLVVKLVADELKGFRQ
ncbi:VWA domain-containing protein [Nonomuraea angiospora]|uniref:Mg-chelatase subunit ChlD n=1 Tax=Nonomuraea angiospora TaxID=46172 RepID=A0ABR9LQN8_9ACTN|nr:vWA domain-containing protein [Nonomuraea angiospora]MBE1582967.1 Mg-chelatase subunit ChlD [Nonomuraea angiospora]